MSYVYEDKDPAFAEKCGDMMLYSTQVGFLKNLAEELIALANEDNWLESFETINNEKKVEAVMENKKLMNAIKEVFSPIQPIFRDKDAKIAQEKRKAAAEALRDGELEKSLGLASQSVLRSPMTNVDESVDGGVSLALGLWLRSEILMRGNRYQAALEDLKMALKERIPARMRGQYYWRLGNCYKGAGEPTRAKVFYEIANRLIDDKKAKIQLHQDMESLDFSLEPKHSENQKGTVLSGGSNYAMPALSDLIEITTDQLKGRYAVASMPIKTGDVLLIDQPYAACLFHKYYGTHCQHCLRRLEDCVEVAPVGCPKCSGVAFCSVQCKDIAISTYHPYECPFMGLFIGSGMSVLSHIALRMVTQVGLETSLAIYSKYLSSEEISNNEVSTNPRKCKTRNRKERLTRSRMGLGMVSDDDVMKEAKNSFEDKQNELLKRADEIYRLCTHSEKRNGDDYLKRIVIAMFLTECLKKSGFFKGDENEQQQANVLSICKLIIQNLQLLQFNAHEIYETLRGAHMFTGSKPSYIAVGIYSTGALFNHECSPAVARYFEGSKIILRAIRPLEAGEMVSENYGPNVLVRNLAERQKSLACRYWFKCDCLACKEDWPLLKQMNFNDPILRCPNILCSWKYRPNPDNPPEKCPKCSVPIEKCLINVYIETVERCLAGYEKGASLMEEERAEEAAAALCAAVDAYHNVGRLPHRETFLAQESLRACFATAGNTHRVKHNPQLGDK
ncbi:PREDICTED: SET and MYND domain-containing protein 4-like [Papilio xuthus]|uniref:SET and MYND domain-containing protein 4-like n=1 Tax=Papilio xuthus TaxID=66420 RepID=A0AAJ7E4J6_PAPXU|nr:PREDICTED: SET and MYND domain-containing protein 4-like [Papilio xuthus]